MSESERGKTQIETRRERIHQLYDLITERYKAHLEKGIEDCPTLTFEQLYKQFYDDNHGINKVETFAEFEFQTGVRRSRTKEYFDILMKTRRATLKGSIWIFLGETKAQELFNEIKAKA